jgi:hypothetical protein
MRESHREGSLSSLSLPYTRFNTSHNNTPSDSCERERNDCVAGTESNVPNCKRHVSKTSTL